MNDIDIQKKAKLKKINEITEKLKIPEEYVEQYGKYKAKISNKYFKKIENNENGKLILVTSINPTPLGEGKTTASIGILDGLCKIGKSAILTLREPSLGPVFGIKGGATGGGMSQVAPMEDINLHFTGDIHAITSANNLLSALIDNHIFHGNEKRIKKVLWKRCLDINDRSLRKIEIGLSNEKGMKRREDGFDISAASEMMAILCLSKDMDDLKRRIGNIIIGYDVNGNNVTCKDINAEGSLTVLLKDAINPNIVQTLENNPVLIHGGPFANIAHGCNSIIATKMALKMSDYTITEAGFGADLGAEKFINIKCRKLEKIPDAVVIIVTLKAIKYHGIKNLKKHISNMKNFGLNVIVAVNKFSDDNDEELKLFKNDISKECEVSILENWSKGSEGSTELASKIVETCEKTAKVNYTYDLADSITEKIEKVSKNIYGASEVEYSEKAKDEINKLQNNETAKLLPICIAKTQYSLSDDPKNLKCEDSFKIHANEVEYKAGAEFIVIKTGKIVTMPGMPKVPAAEKIDIDNDGNVIGIF